MTEARPLREVFADLADSADSAGYQGADPAELLAAHGHPGLPEELVAEAVVSYADTAPAEVAEHLAPFVTAHSAIPVDEPGDTPWFELMSTAPEPEPPDLDSPLETLEFGEDPGLDLDFGAGAGVAAEDVVEVADLPVPEHHAAPAGDDLGWEPMSQEPAGTEHPVDLPDDADTDDDDGDLFD
jgi:hypothetical protein